MPSPYWNTQLAPLNQGLGNLSQGLARLPIARAQGAMLGARAQSYGAMAQEDAARTALLSGQLEHLQSGDKAVDAAAKASADYLRTLQLYQDNPAPENLKALEDSTSAAGGAMSAAQKSGNPQILTSAFQKIMSLNQAVGGNTSQAANIANPVAMQENVNNNAQKAATPQIIPSGATQTTQTGQPLSTGGVTLSPAQQRFAPQGNLGVPDVQPAQMVASVSPNPPTPPPAARPQTPPFQNPGVLAAIFKQNLVNSSGGTNTDQAIQQTLRQTGTAPGGVGAAPGGVGAAPAPTTQNPPKIMTQEDYDALPVGSQYVDWLGRAATKRGK